MSADSASLRHLSGQQKLAVWDVDGTLIDSRSSIFRAAVEAASMVGISPPTYDEVRAIVGMSLASALHTMRPELTPAQLDAYVHEFKEAFVRFHGHADFHEALYPGAADTLLALKAEGWLLGMATGQSRRGVERNLDLHGWRPLFDVTFCADDGPSKPHPHMLQRNMHDLGIDSHRTVMIGDTAHDMTMGRNAGVRTIGVSWGFHTVEELQLAGADQIVHSFDALKTALDAFTPVPA